MGPSRSSTSPAKYSPGHRLLCMVRESTSSRTMPPAVTSARPKPSVPVNGSRNRLMRPASRGRRMATDRPADIEDNRAGKSEVREQQRSPSRRNPPIIVEDANSDVRESDAAQVGDPADIDSQGHECGAGRDDGVAETAREIV